MSGGAWRARDPAAVEDAVLGLLYRCQFVTTDHLIRFLWNAPSCSTLRKRLAPTLNTLLRRNEVWRSAYRLTPGYRSHRSGYASGGWTYGLTDTGRDLAQARSAELRHVQTITHEGYLSESGRRTLLHATHATEWCVRLMTALRPSPYLAGLWLELESTVLGRHLRMDGLLRLRLWTAPHPHTVEPSWWLPWLATLRTPLGAGMIDATFALEIDEGTEQLEIITGKARNYARTYGGHDVQWPSVLCPADLPTTETDLTPWFPIPVFITTSDQRLANLRAAWQAGWPNCELRLTTWAHINQTPKFLNTPYLNHEGKWVDLMGLPL